MGVIEGLGAVVGCPNSVFRSGRTEAVFGWRPGDPEGDGKVDLTNFLTLERRYGGEEHPPTPECPTHMVAYLDQDDYEDLADLLIFQQHSTGRW